ncbi:MAG: hypothetical protein OSJ74_09170 [Clostridia bacterium]|nr:hypothetical protein [Clostridia bacterium]
MQILNLAAISFHWERLTQPSVIVGICVMLVGLILSFCSKPISAAIGKRRRAKGEEPNEQMLYTAFKFVSMGVVFIGMLVAIVTMQWK